MKIADIYFRIDEQYRYTIKVAIRATNLILKYLYRKSSKYRKGMRRYLNMIDEC